MNNQNLKGLPSLEMDPEDRKRLLVHRLAFVEDVEALDLLGYLYQDHVISVMDKENVEGRPTRRARIETLLDIIPRKGPYAFEHFCTTLRKFDCYKHLVDLLEPKDEEDNPASRRESLYAKPITTTRAPFNRLRSRPRSDLLNEYPMQSVPRGWCFIINNVYFYSLADRTGSKIDAENLQNFFTALGLRVWLVNNVEAKEIREKFEELAAKTDHGDCLVVCILSHGLSGQIYGIDSELVSVSEILDIINSGVAGTSLKGKPKMFLIQACRVTEKENNSINDKSKKERGGSKKKKIYSSQVIASPNVEDGEEEEEFTGPKPIKDDTFHNFIEESRMHVYSDMVLAYSTFPGEVSWRHTSHGSYFIDSVLDVFGEYFHVEDVLSMLVKVNQLVLSRLRTEGVEQIPAPVFTLTKKFHLE